MFGGVVHRLSALGRSANGRVGHAAAATTGHVAAAAAGRLVTRGRLMLTSTLAAAAGMAMMMPPSSSAAAAAPKAITKNRRSGHTADDGDDDGSATMTPSHAEQAPDGNETSLSTKASSISSMSLQKFTPINNICRHVCGVHMYAHDPNRQVIAHHYCSHLNDKIHQCVIYDSDKSGARLIGIEYIITEDLFEALPDDEKKFWHSHQYEVSSGQLIAPNVPLTVETKMMNTLVTTYGKTIHTWQIDRGDTLPLGAPQLMIAPTADGQIDESLLQARDTELDLRYDTARRRKARRKLRMHLKPVDAGADQWTKGNLFQFEAVAMQGSGSSNNPSGTITGSGARDPKSKKHSKLH